MKHQWWRLGAILALVVALLCIGTMSTDALAQSPEVVFVTNPADGETVSGLMTVTGAADFPDFFKYEVLLKSGNQLAWVATGYAPVINGNLARLDSRIFLDGTYQMVIRQVRSDSNYTDFPGPTFTIENGLGSPLPVPEIESSFLYPPASGALARIKNCAGRNLEFDYTGVEGSCSADMLWIMPKTEDSPICPAVDVLLRPCEYRGTAVGEGEPRGSTYSLVVEAGKVYQFDYAGDARLFIGEIPGDERAGTDTGGFNQGDSMPVQAPPAAKQAAGSVSAAQPATSARTKAGAPQQDSLLPVSGQGHAADILYTGVAGSLILFLIVGGVIAARKRGSTSQLK